MLVAPSPLVVTGWGVQVAPGEFTEGLESPKSPFHFFAHFQIAFSHYYMVWFQVNWMAYMKEFMRTT